MSLQRMHRCPDLNLYYRWEDWESVPVNCPRCKEVI